MFVFGLVALFFGPLVGALLAISGAVLVSGRMITEALNRKWDAFEVLQNSREEEMPAID